MILGSRERESKHPELWKAREKETLELLKTIFPTTSIIALQEYWLNDEYSHYFQQVLEENGYELKTLQRTGKKMDAVCIAVKKDDFSIVS